MKKKPPVKESPPPESDGGDFSNLSPGERMGMAWQLSVKAYGLTQEEAKARLRKDVMVLKRLKDK